MRRQELFRHSSQCHGQCIPDPEEDIYSHEDNTAIHHDYIRSKHLQDHFKRYQNFLQQHLRPFQEYQKGLMQKIQRMKQELDRFEQDLQMKIKEYGQKFQGALFKDQKDRFIVSTIKDFNFEALTCFQMSKLIKMTDKGFLEANQPKLKNLSQRKIQQIQQSFMELAKNVFSSNKIEIVSAVDKNLLNMIKLNESSIVKVANESAVSDDFGDLKGLNDFFGNVASPPPVSMAKKISSQVFQSQKVEKEDYDIVEEEEDQSFYQKQNISSSSKLTNASIKQEQPKYVDKEPSLDKSSRHNSAKQEKKEEKQVKEEKEIKKEKEIKEEETQVKKGRKKYKKTQSDKQDSADLDDESQQIKDDNQQQISKAAKTIQAQLSSNSMSLLSQLDESETFHTISDLDDALETLEDLDGVIFNMRVKVVKVLYICVIYRTVLKMKFVAGDQTGIGVFFTNYWSEIKPGCKLLMNQCKFTNYKQSIEIVNNKNFTKINEGKDTIIANIDGIRLTEYLEQDLYYTISDKNCTLIRKVAERLTRGNANTTKIHRMIVKVMFILNQWTTGAFCQVGDSSGLMFAYLKRDGMKAITEGSVVKITHLTAKRGQEPNKLIQEEIFYLDTFSATAKVVEFPSEFLEISDKIMTVES